MGSQVVGPALVAIGDGTAQPGCLRIEDGRIAGIDDRSARADHVLPPGCTITPGLIDLHVNGTGRYWFNREPLDTMAAMTVEAPTRGVTAYLPSIMTGAWDHMLRAGRVISGHLNDPVSDLLDTMAAMTVEAPTRGVTAYLPSIMTGAWDHMLRAGRVISGHLNDPV